MIETLERFQGPVSRNGEIVSNLWYADGIDLLASSEEEMFVLADNLNKTYITDYCKSVRDLKACFAMALHKMTQVNTIRKKRKILTNSKIKLLRVIILWKQELQALNLIATNSY